MKKLLAILFVAIGMMSCEKEETCRCENNGQCVDGTCDCPPGWSGENCEKHTYPASVKITGIELRNYPGFDGSIQWDEGSNPDLQVTLTTGQNCSSDYDHATEVGYEASSNMIYGWSSLSWIYPNISEELTICLFDIDAPALPDYMGSASFRPIDYLDGEWPGYITISAAGMTVGIYLSY
jgi:hypothetical protein